MDPYETLGVNRNATDDEVKKAYRELSRKYHPDANANNPLKELAEEKFKEVQAAYSQIMDERENGGAYGQNSTQNPFGGYQSGGYQRGYQNGGQQGYNPYQRQQYQSYGNRYGRDPYGGSTCGTGNLCCDLWCADTLCECMGGDLCTCF